MTNYYCTCTYRNVYTMPALPGPRQVDFICFYNSLWFTIIQLLHVHKVYTQYFNTEEANKRSKQRIKRQLSFSGSSPPAVCTVCHHYHCHTAHPMCQGFIQDFFARGEIRFYVFLNMYSLLCFPLFLLLSFIWQWFSKCKK